MELKDSHRAILRACGELRSFSEGQNLLRRGAESSSILLLLEGRVKLLRETPYGDFLLGEVGPQGYLGEVLFCSGQTRTSDARASESGTLLVVKPKTLQLAMASNDGFEVAMLWQFWSSLSAKLRHANEALETFFLPSSTKPPALPRPAAPKASNFDVQRRRETIRLLGLSNMEINFLASVADPLRLEPDQVLFREGDVADCLYIVAEGRVMISKEIPGAGTEALCFVDPGGLVGEMGVVDDMPRCADAMTTASGATLLRVQAETLAKVLHPGRASSVRLMRFLCRQQALRLQATYEKIIGWYILSGGTLHAR
jgi:CRP-like cAMP-binding protein